MEYAGHTAGHDHEGARGNAVEAELASLIDVYGLQILEHPEQIRLLLAQACSDAEQHIAALLAALGAHVPQRLRAAQDDRNLPGQLRRSVQQVQEHGSLDEGWSAWAVRAWAHALALPTTALDPSAPVAAPAPEDGTGFAAVVTPLSAAPHPDAHAPARTVEVAAPLPREEGNASARREPFFQDDAPDATHADGTPVSPADTTHFIEPLFAEHPHRLGVSREDEVGPSPPWSEPHAAPRRRGMGLAIVALLVVMAAAIYYGVDAWQHATHDTPATTTAAPPAPPSVVASAPVVPPPAPASEPPLETPSPANAPPPQTIAPAQVEPAAPPTATPATTEPPTTRPADATTEQPPPRIDRIDVPRIVEGAPFALALHVAGDTRDVASVERRFVEGRGAWSGMPASLPVTRLRRSGPHALLVPFRAMSAPARATFEFTIVSRDRARSEPLRATVTVVEAPAIALSPGACTPSTCGAVSVVRAREAESGARPAMYEMLVRMDDGAFHTVPVPYRLQAGSRVRLVGDRFVPLR